MIDKTTPMRNIPAIKPGIEGYWSGQRYWPVDETPELVRQATAHYTPEISEKIDGIMNKIHNSILLLHLLAAGELNLEEANV